MNNIKLGIPRAFLYHRYGHLWEAFFDALGVDYIISPNTDKSIVKQGSVYAIDESCLSSKIYLGHVDWLLDRCDAVFVPRVSNFGKGKGLCTKFSALYDIVANTFYARDINIIDYNLDMIESGGELAAFYDLGTSLGAKRRNTLSAYNVAKNVEKAALAKDAERQMQLLETDGIKILVVGHSYNIYDEYIGKPVLEYLHELGATPILADAVDRKQALAVAGELTDTMPWLFNLEQIGAVQLLRDKVDGIILMTAFPCGPDSLSNEVILRRVKGLPILNLLLDAQDGSAGIETRLESFIDIITFRQEAEISQEV